MPILTPEQKRIQALMAGDNSANFAAFKQQQNANQDAIAQRASTPVGDGPSLGQLEPEYAQQTRDPGPAMNFQDNIRRRFSQVDQMGTQATNDALAAARQAYADKMVAANNAAASGPMFNPNITADERRRAVLNAAASQAGMPYAWGGGNAKGPTEGGSSTRSTSGGPVGFDCSGLVQYAFAQVGISMPHYNQSQLALGTKAPISSLQPGDLVGTSGHVAVYAGNGMMWEAPTFGKSVRYTPVRSGMFGVHINY